jgi:hypothetical protein
MKEGNQCQMNLKRLLTSFAQELALPLGLLIGQGIRGQEFEAGVLFVLLLRIDVCSIKTPSFPGLSHVS